jgi:hypothetical protein
VQIKPWDALEVATIPGYERETMMQSGCSDQQVKVAYKLALPA